nr:RNase adapter RapZ [Desulfobulbaceae bacterium]
MTHCHEHPRLFLITGLSGAGKGTVAKTLEDSGFFCIDNLPVFILHAFLSQAQGHPERNKLALVMDARDPDFLARHQEVIATLEASPFHLTIIFLTADDDVLLRRYSEMRRKHPLADTVREGIVLEKAQLADLRDKADHIFDTTTMSPHLLRAEVLNRCLQQKNQPLLVTVVSFGFKHGPPAEADILFDVRFLPNPYFVPELKDHTGLEPQVSSFVLKSEAATEFLGKLTPLLQFLIPQYKKEGKAYLTIGIGCTGGKHRSVSIAGKLKQVLEEAGESVSVNHRDLGQ